MMQIKKRLQVLEDWIDSRCHKWEVTRRLPFLGDETDLMIMESRLNGVPGISTRHSSRFLLEINFKGDFYKMLSVIKRVQFLVKEPTDEDPIDKDAYKHFKNRFQIRLLEGVKSF